MSVYNMINYLGYKAKISNSQTDINNSSIFYLVGSFKSSMYKIKRFYPY